MIESNDQFVLLRREFPINMKVARLFLEVVNNFGSPCEQERSVLDSSADLEKLRDRSKLKISSDLSLVTQKHFFNPCVTRES